MAQLARRTARGERLHYRCDDTRRPQECTGRLSAPRQAPPRQAPPRQAPPRQAPPRQAPPRQAPPRRATSQVRRGCGECLLPHGGCHGGCLPPPPEARESGEAGATGFSPRRDLKLPGWREVEKQNAARKQKQRGVPAIFLARQAGTPPTARAAESPLASDQSSRGRAALRGGAAFGGGSPLATSLPASLPTLVEKRAG